MVGFSNSVFLAGLPIIFGQRQVVLNDLIQGSEFTECINVNDFGSKGPGDPIVVFSRMGNGCCSNGHIPGVKQIDTRWGAMIMCGFETDGSINWGDSANSCNYRKCYVVKMGVQCNDGSPMRLNGCCPSSSNCRYERRTQTFANVGNVEYCTSYASIPSIPQTLGTPNRNDDIIGGGGYLNLNAFSAYTQCPGAFSGIYGTIYPQMLEYGMYPLNKIGEDPSYLSVCQGDCDNDAQCPYGSRCVQRTSAAQVYPGWTVEGCSVGDSMNTAGELTDYCSNPGSNTYLFGHKQYPLTRVGENPTVGTLAVCQGDCDLDTDCPGLSMCVQRGTALEVYPTWTVQGCSIGDSTATRDTNTDYCSNPFTHISDTCQDMKDFFRFKNCCGNPGGSTGSRIIPTVGYGNHFETYGNPCLNKKPNIPDGDCFRANLEAVVEQAGADVSVNYRGDGIPGNTANVQPLTTPFHSSGLCAVNVHWHLGAEHRSVGQYSEAFAMKGPLHKIYSPSSERRGMRCNLYNPLDPRYTTDYHWRYCSQMTVGETYEVHWPHSTMGACGTTNQYQYPFYDGVFCNYDGNLPAPQQMANVIGVEAQVFVIINDEAFYYPNLIRGMIREGGYGTQITSYTGSTTGTTRNNQRCSNYAPITWQVDRQCHMISASSFDKMCADMMDMKDDMRPDTHPHGARELVWSNLTANNQRNRRLHDGFQIHSMVYGHDGESV